MGTTLADGLRLAINKLQARNATIGQVVLNGVTYQIRYFPDTYPATLETAYLPCILIFVDDGTTESLDDTKISTANFRMVCYLANTAEGIYDDILQAGLLFLQRLIELYGDLATDIKDTRVLDYGTTSQYRIEVVDVPFTWTGIRSDYQYTKEDVFYWGFSFTVQMQIGWGLPC
jgi:hypothetical protein